MSVRSHLRKAFRPHAAAVKGLENRLLADEAAHTLPGYVTQGSTSYIFRVESAPGILFKLPYADQRGRVSAVRDIGKYVGGLVRGLGRPGLEQIACYRPAFPAAVGCYEVPGRVMDRLNHKELGDVPAQHLSGLWTTFQAMQELDLWLDAEPVNLILHTETGITVIDYEHRPGEQSLVDKAMAMADDVLLYHTRRGDFVPPAALAWRDICARDLGSTIVESIHAEWRAQRYVTPG